MNGRTDDAPSMDAAKRDEAGARSDDRDMDPPVSGDASPAPSGGMDARVVDADIDASDAGHDSGIDSGPEAGPSDPPMTGCMGNVGGLSAMSGGLVVAAPAHAQAGAYFGYSVGLSQDWLFVTAPFERAAVEQIMAEAKGALHVARQVGAEFGPFSAIGPTGAVAGDGALAAGTSRFNGPTLGNYRFTVVEDRVILGVSTEDGAAPDSGAVYVFEQRNGAWQETQRFEAPTPQACGFFGFGVAAEGDLLVVTAPGEGIDGTPTCTQPEATRAGAAYVYRHDGSGYALEQRLPTLNALGGDHFGWSAAVSNGDIAVGSLWERNSTRTLDAPTTAAYGSGAIYVFRKADEWELAHYIKADPITGNAGFGADLVFTDDALIVGAPFDSGCSGSPIEIPIPDQLPILTGGGAVYVFDRSDFSQRQCLYGAVPDRMDEFGKSVAVDGDRLIVGAPSDFSADQADPSNDGSPYSGAVYAFARQQDDRFGCAAYVKPPPATGVEQRYGYSLSAASGLVAVGAPGASHSAGFQAGAVDLLRFATDP